MSTTNPPMRPPPSVASGAAMSRSQGLPRPSTRTGSGRFSAMLEGTRPMRAGCASGALPGAGTHGAAGGIPAAAGGPQGGKSLGEALASAEKPRSTRANGAEADPTLLAPFVPPPSILAIPLSVTNAGAPTTSGAQARAEAAILSERLIRSLRVGKVGRDGHEVRLRLDVGARGDVEVRLRHVDGALSATLVTDSASCAGAEQLAAALRRELSGRGIECDEVEIAIG